MEFLFVRFVFLFSFLFRLNFCTVNFASFPQRGKRSRPYRFILLSMDCLEKYMVAKKISEQNVLSFKYGMKFCLLN